MAEPVLTVHGLAQHFGQVAALDGVDFEAADGTASGCSGLTGQARRSRCKC
jgi:ABC-type branched-subunit amino acid transport system ATPase component